MLVAFVRYFSKMSLKPLLFLSFNLLVCTFLFTSLPIGVAMSNASEDYTSLVFNGCSKQMFPNNAYPENLKSLMDSLVSSSSLKLFSAATATSSDRTNGINGLYQCRGDLSPAECNTCLSKIPPLVSQLCGQTSVAARIQLGGCYLHYEIADLKPSDATELLYKRCDDQVKAAGIGEKRDTAFGILENDVKNSTSPEVGGLYTSSYDAVNISGQCEGTLANQLDCLTCLQSASQKAKTECGDSISGKIYLYSCYISYSASSNVNGVPYSRKVAAGSGKKDSGSKTAAIVIASVFFGAIILGAAVYYIRKSLNSR